MQVRIEVCSSVTSARGLAGDDADEDLDRIQPRAAARGEMQCDPWSGQHSHLIDHRLTPGPELIKPADSTCS